MAKPTPDTGDALLIVDVQNDFLPGGSLAVPGGDAVVPVLRCCLTLFTERHLPVFASRDWHPHDHCSFRAQGGPWPAHCIAGTAGAEFPPGLAVPPDATIISKADHRYLEAFSAFGGTGLDARLKASGVRRLFVGGLATDFCVLRTVQDALTLGYSVVLLSDAVRAADVTPGDGVRALRTMAQQGAQFASSGDLVT